MKKFLLLLFTITITLTPAVLRAAVGDTAAACSSVANNAFLDIQPGSGVEWVVHNLWFEDNVELQRYDGTNAVAVAQYSQGFKDLVTHVTNSNRIRVKNIHGSAAKLICYDAIVTK